jgi:tetratricopeptide (TPR) repeat protein
MLNATYLKALASKPDNLPIYRTLADIYRSQSRYNEAIDIMRRGLRLSPVTGVCIPI